MQSRHPGAQRSDKCIGLLLILSMLFVSGIELAGFPLYSLLLFLAAAGWAAAKIFWDRQKSRSLISISHWTDIAALIVIVYELLAAVAKLFRDPDKGAIDFSINAVMIAFALLYLLFSAEVPFKAIYFDFITYSGLFVSGAFIFYYLTDIEPDKITQTVFKDSGAGASYLLLICMCSVYLYCFSKDRIRSMFYLLVSAVAFFALFLNRNVVSFWMMAVYFISMPIVLRPTASLIKKDMQLFFLFMFMLSNMSLLTQYTSVIQKELSFSLEGSVYLDLLLAIGGIFFFHYWDKIPEDIDLERLVMRKMRRGYLFLLKITGILFLGIMIGADRWKTPIEGISGDIIEAFALPLTEGIRKNESGFYYCFQNLGIIGGVFAVVLCLTWIGMMKRKTGFDRPVTGILVLISSIFMLQLLFWKPGVNTVAVYLLLLLFAVRYEEEKVKIPSIKLHKEALKELTINLKDEKGMNTR